MKFITVEAFIHLLICLFIFDYKSVFIFVTEQDLSKRPGLDFWINLWCII